MENKNEYYDPKHWHPNANVIKKNYLVTTDMGNSGMKVRAFDPDDAMNVAWGRLPVLARVASVYLLENSADDSVRIEPATYTIVREFKRET